MKMKNHTVYYVMNIQRFVGGRPMNKEGITVAGNLIADVVYTIDVYPQKGNLTWMRNPVAIPEVLTT